MVNIVVRSQSILVFERRVFWKHTVNIITMRSARRRFPSSIERIRVQYRVRRKSLVVFRSLAMKRPKDDILQLFRLRDDDALRRISWTEHSYLRTRARVSCRFGRRSVVRSPAPSFRVTIPRLWETDAHRFREEERKKGPDAIVHGTACSGNNALKSATSIVERER